MADATVIKETLMDKVEKLVTWYERNKPEAGMRIEVVAGPKQLAKALGVSLPLDETGKPKEVREWPYRGRTLVAIGQDGKR